MQEDPAMFRRIQRIPQGLRGSRGPRIVQQNLEGLALFRRSRGSLPVQRGSNLVQDDPEDPALFLKDPKILFRSI